MRRLLLILFSLMAAGCAVSKDSSDQNTAQLRQNKLVDDTYGPLVGTYDGQIKGTVRGDEKAQLVIYISGDPATNPDGTPGTKRTPRAFLRRIDPVVVDYSLVATGYYPEIGTLSLGNDGKTPDIKSVEAVVKGTHITGDVQMFTGTLGQLDVTLTSKQTTAPDDLRDRLLRAFQKVQGEYRGFIISANSAKPKTPVTISLIALLTGDTPTMIGFYKRPDVNSGNIDLPLTVQYNPNTNPPILTMHGKGGGKYEIDMNGTLMNEVISASFNTLFEGHLGTLIANKVNSDSPSPAPKPKPTPAGDLWTQYQAVAGRYQADFTAGKRTLSVSVTLIASRVGKKPLLTATYRRLDKAGSTDLSLRANYDPTTSPPTIGLQGGHKGAQVSLQGFLVNDEMHVNLTGTDEGNFGNVVLRKQ